MLGQSDSGKTTHTDSLQLCSKHVLVAQFVHGDKLGMWKHQ